MKFCPTCETRYDEEILRFCTKDGTPLVDENQPNFTEMPSESLEPEEDDIGEQTLVRYKPKMSSIPEPEQQPEPEIDRSEAPRIVISTNEEKREQQVRSRAIPPYQPPPQGSGVGKVVALTIFGTLAVLAFGLALFMILRDDEQSANTNINVNTNPPDTNINNNLNFGGFNFNVSNSANINTNTNVNTNANANKTATPTPKPTPSPSNVNTNTNTGINSNSAPPNNTRPANVTPSGTPRTSPSPLPSGRPVNLGVVNGRAVTLPKPAYPQTARQMGASGQVAVQVLIDEAGNVTSAKATSGNQLLRQSAEAAARQTKFNPTVINNQAVKATGILLYNFVN